MQPLTTELGRNGSQGHAPRVSVGLPVYNGERYVQESIDSILNQTLIDFELVISDNASTDRTEAICTGYAAKDSRVHYHRNPQNLGAAKNFRRVFELSRAPYFRFAHHDDVCAPRLLEECVRILDANPKVVLCYPRSAYIDEHGTIIAEHYDGCNLRSPRPSERVLQYFAEADARCLPMFGLIRRQALLRTSVGAPVISSDKLLLLQLALLGEFYEFPERLFFCRDHVERGSRQFNSFAGVAAWFDPTRGSGIQFPRWRLAYEFLKSVGRARIEFGEAQACYVSVLKWCKWNYIQLVRDVALAAQQISSDVLGWPAATKHNGPGNPWSTWRL